MSNHQPVEKDQLYKIRHSAAHVMAEAVLGIYPEAAQTACRDGIAACIEASNAAEDLVAAATEAAGVAAAEKALVLPEIAR